jgi:hypothetical protein
MSRTSQDYLIDECNSLLKLMNGQVEKINQSFYSKVIQKKKNNADLAFIKIFANLFFFKITF